jgi:hypothetical protein
MADDDIERLLREIQQSGGGAVEPVEQTPSGGRVGFALLAAVGSGAVGAVGGLLLWFVPFIGPVTTGAGAALGGFLTALIAGPPRWFSR